MSEVVKRLIGCGLILALVGHTLCAPTKEVDLETGLTVKKTPAQEDLDQFFKDQAHLANTSDEKKEDDETSGLFGRPVIVGFIGQTGSQLSQVTDTLDLASIINQFNLPNVNSAMIVAPLNVFSQIFWGW